jgi:hypothetical protein
MQQQDPDVAFSELMDVFIPVSQKHIPLTTTITK